jgi:hypothetical protein
LALRGIVEHGTRRGYYRAGSGGKKRRKIN